MVEIVVTIREATPCHACHQIYRVGIFLHERNFKWTKWKEKNKLCVFFLSFLVYSFWIECVQGYRNDVHVVNNYNDEYILPQSRKTPTATNEHTERERQRHCDRHTQSVMKMMKVMYICSMHIFARSRMNEAIIANLTTNRRFFFSCVWGFFFIFWKWNENSKCLYNICCWPVMSLALLTCCCFLNVTRLICSQNVFSP